MANDNVSDLSARWFMEDQEAKKNHREPYKPKYYSCSSIDYYNDPKTYDGRRYQYEKVKISEVGTVIVMFFVLHAFFVLCCCIFDATLDLYWELFLLYLPLDGIIVMMLAFASSFFTRRYNASQRRKWNVDTEEDRRLDKMNDAVTLGIIAGLGATAGKQVKSATRPHNKNI